MDKSNILIPSMSLLHGYKIFIDRDYIIHNNNYNNICLDVIENEENNDLLIDLECICDYLLLHVRYQTPLNSILKESTITTADS